MPQIPRTLIVVGGGVIGVEYACMFATLGVRVIIVEKRPRLLEFADAEIVEALSYQKRDRRATMRLNEEVESVEELPDGRVAANLVGKKRINADALLYARRPPGQRRTAGPVSSWYRSRQPRPY
jgi:NAD(P) transhydrogenase